MAGFSTDPNPRLTHFAPDSSVDQKSAAVVFAGGGYRTRSEHEGEGYARTLAARGIHAFVCDYRVLGDRTPLHPAPIEDALFAIHAVRSRAGEAGFSPRNVGVVGSSAGGHLAAHLSTAWKDFGPRFRPDWSVLCYPVIVLFGPAVNAGSRDALLGPDATDEEAAALSPHAMVDSATPPAFLWHTFEDDVVPVENPLLYAEALRNAGVPFELHVGERGAHGLGQSADFDWLARAVQWLEITGRIGCV